MSYGLYRIMRSALIALLLASLASPVSAQGQEAQLAEAKRLNQEAAKLAKAGRYSEAVPLSRRVLAIREKALGPDHPDVAESLDNLGFLYAKQGDYERAAPLFQRSLAILEKAVDPDHPAVATVLENLAELYQVQGDYERAEPLYRRALAINEKALGREHTAVARVLNGLGSLYFEQGDYGRAAPFLQLSLNILVKAQGPEHPSVATQLNGLASLYYKQVDYGRAAPLFQRALAIREKALGPDHPDVARALNNLAVLYEDQGDCERAASLYQRTLAIYEKALGSEHPDVAMVLNNLAMLYLDKSDYGQAGPFLQRALAIYEKALGPEHPDVAMVLNNLAALYFHQGDYDRVAPLNLRALAIIERALGPEHPDVGDSLNSLVELYQAKGDYAPAINFQKRASAVEEKNITQILSTGSQRQKQLYLNTLSGETYHTVSLHARDMPQNGDAARLALTVILQRKGRALDATSDQIAALRRRAAPDDQKLLDQLIAVQSQLSALELSTASKLSPETRRAEIRRLNAEQERLEDAISRRSTEFRAVVQPITLEAVRQAIPPDAALVELFIYKPFNAQAWKGTEPKFSLPRYVAYVLRRADEAPQFVDLGEAKAIDADAAKFRAALKNAKTPEAQVKELARNLDERVMRPVRKLLGQTKRVFLSPDGALNLVPFDALIDEDSHYLIENYSFNYLTSGRDLLRLQVESKSKDASTIVANPLFNLNHAAEYAGGQRGLLDAGKTVNVEARAIDFTKLYYPPLVGTAAEAKSIGALLPQTRMWIQGDATEAALKTINRPRILHIATHGFFLPDQTLAAPTPAKGRQLSRLDTAPAGPQRENPMLRSGLILAGVNQKQSGVGEDGVLTAQETAGLNLFGTKLVVLSACETGLGDVQNGAGVYGLRRALVLAGSETQVMSLWQVSDEATRDLMIAYYTRLQAGTGRIAALHEVQLAMLRGAIKPKSGDATAGWRHPYYWAAFIPSGAWTALEEKPITAISGATAPGPKFGNINPRG